MPWVGRCWEASATAQGSFRLNPGIRSTVGAAESGTGLGRCFVVGPAEMHRLSTITAGSGILVARQYLVEESGKCTTPRLRCRSSFREPYNFCLQATVGVKDIIINRAVVFAHRA